MSVDQEAVHTVIRGINKFSAEFIKILSEDNANKNIICSPISISLVLSMATYGARELTEEQLRLVLHLPNDTVAKNGFQCLIDTLNNFEGVELHLANKIFTASGFKIENEFKNISETTFRSVSENIDFNKIEEASKKINQWCQQKTNNRIKNIVEPNDLNDIALIMINAVYFKGNWAEKFDPTLTSLQPFYVNNNTIKQVPMMYKSGKYNFGWIDELNAQFVELPYQSNNNKDAISMFVILPDESNGLKSIDAHLDKIDFTKLHGPPQKVDIQIPKFKIESKFDLKETLQKMGIKEMFENTANFSGINSTSPLKVSKVIQKAFIEVNEEGSEAAAVTGLQIMLMCMPMTIVFNRPFICVIVAHESGTQLFNGRIIDPTI